MALFKIYKGNKEYLPKTMREGYVYFTTDEGCLYVDISDTQRVKVKAAGAYSLLDEYGDEIAVEDLVTIHDIIPPEQGGTGNADGNAPTANKLKTPCTLQVNLNSEDPATFDGSAGVMIGISGVSSIAHGGTGGSTSATARTNLDVYSKKETDDKVAVAATVAYNVTLGAAWVATADGKFQYEYENTELTCGVGGDVPPIITPVSNQSEYNYIESADATPGSGIVFVAIKQPASAIGIIVVDNK